MTWPMVDARMRRKFDDRKEVLDEAKAAVSAWWTAEVLYA